MQTQTLRKKAGETGRFVQYEQTEFGREVGRDEINWWVFKKGPNLDELRQQTEKALGAAQTLKKAAEALKESRPETYEELLAILRGFADSHGKEIEVLHEYVRWLSIRDVLAPKILFTYRVWGSTRMGVRSVDVDAAPVHPGPPNFRCKCFAPDKRGLSLSKTGAQGQLCSSGSRTTSETGTPPPPAKT